MININELKQYIKAELLKTVELIEYTNSGEDKSLTDAIKVVMIRDNLTNLVDYINEEITNN